MSSTEQSSAMERNVLKRATSSAPAWPMIRCVSNPLAFHAVYTIASSGLDTMMMIDSGACSATWPATLLTILTLV